MLTRFRLELALLGESEDVAALNEDVDKMQAMLEDYLSFARTDVDEAADDIAIAALVRDAARGMDNVTIDVADELTGHVRPMAVRRLLTNLIQNAATYATRIAVTAVDDGPRLRIMVDDNGPGIPSEEREAVFRPFYRLDQARNQDDAGTGLGLSIARDIARRHGGDVVLGASPMGGLRARITLPR
ncbi:MAG: ATP-binding protein, partial [Pseudomonadota bacterium]